MLRNILLIVKCLFWFLDAVVVITFYGYSSNEATDIMDVLVQAKSCTNLP